MFSQPLFGFIIILITSRVSSELSAGCALEQDQNSKDVYRYVDKIVRERLADEVVTGIIGIHTRVVSDSDKTSLKKTKTIVAFWTENLTTHRHQKCIFRYLNEPSIKEPIPQNLACVKARIEKQFVKDIDSSESELLEQLSEIVTTTFDDLDPDIWKKIVVDVKKAKKQISNGILYYLTLEIKSTSCLETEIVTPDQSCLNKETQPRKICEVTVHRSFTNNSPMDKSESYLKLAPRKQFQVVYSKCSSVDDVLYDRSASITANDKYIKEVADFAMKHINVNSNSIYIKGILNIRNSNIQLDSGMKINLTLEVADTDCTKNSLNNTNCKFLHKHNDLSVCDVSVLDRNNQKTVLSQHCSSRVKRSSLRGGELEIDVNDNKIQGLKGYISNELTQRANSLYTKTVVKVFKATTQIVSGSLTKATVEVADTNCLKSENKSPSECVTSEQGRQLCEIAIWEQPWLNKKEITQSECHSIQGSESPQRVKLLARMFGVDKDNSDLTGFLEFVRKEEKQYKTDKEFKQRFRIFRANMKKISALQFYEQGTAVYGVTKFADLSAEEFKRNFLGFNHNPNYVPKKPRKMAVIPNITLPNSFDWRDHNVVTPVKNQGFCGSCWAFSVTGNVEGLYAIKTGHLLSFSEQELVDCDKYDAGCQGGFFDTAYHAIEDLGGLETESDYPYLGEKETCAFKRAETRVSISGGLNISHNENDMAKFLVVNGPISIALNANAMQFYWGGVSHPPKFLCNPNNLDHGVLIVGYGVHRTKFTKKMLPYWLIKNSWGKSWGNQGYYMVYRGDGTCGVNQSPSTAILS